MSKPTVIESAQRVVAEWRSHGGEGTHQECLPGCGCQMREAVDELADALEDAEGVGE